MQIGMIGLGRMGANISIRLMRGGHQVVVNDLSEAAVQSVSKQGAEGARTLEELVQKLDPPRSVWVMVPSGDPTETTVMSVAKLLSPGDTIIDGGNSNYKDSMRRAAALREMDLNFLDVGTSGGIWGLAEGYSMMIGGDGAVVERLRPVFETLAPGPDRGWGHVGPSGAGHFTKMVHNGIEYGMMEALSEGFDLMHSKSEFELDLHQVAEVWRFGSVVRSWLLDLTARALEDNPEMEGIAPYVADSGEGRWTAIEAIDQGVSIPVITLALQRRFQSQDESPFGNKLLAAMRHQFGGHAIRRK